MRWRQQEDKPTEQRIERKSNAFKSSIDKHQITLIFNFTLATDLLQYAEEVICQLTFVFRSFVFSSFSSNVQKISAKSDPRMTYCSIVNMVYCTAYLIELIWFFYFLFSQSNLQTRFHRICGVKFHWHSQHCVCITMLEQHKTSTIAFAISNLHNNDLRCVSLVSIQFLFCDFGFYLGKSWNKQQHQHCPLITICKVSMIIFVNSHNLCLIAWFVFL